MSDQVDILLATYQGALYLEAQLDSLFTQTYPHLHVWARDDGSSDQTTLILQKWVDAYPQKMTLIPTTHRLGIKGNFSELMKWSQAPYIMFADQDDQWLPDKIETSLKLLKAMEKHYSSHVPLLIHTDLKVVDQNLKEIAFSFWHYTGLKPALTSLNRLLSQNTLTGCTLLMNRTLLELAYPIPEEAIMHDWWIALVASSFGHIQFLNRPTLLYRQHGYNDTGAKRYSLWHFLHQSSKELQKKTTSTYQTYQQAKVFSKKYKHVLSTEKVNLCKAYAELEHLSYFRKKYQLIKHRFFKQGFLRNIKQLILD